MLQFNFTVEILFSTARNGTIVSEFAIVNDCRLFLDDKLPFPRITEFDDNKNTISNKWENYFLWLKKFIILIRVKLQLIVTLEVPSYKSSNSKLCGPIFTKYLFFGRVFSI